MEPGMSELPTKEDAQPGGGVSLSSTYHTVHDPETGPLSESVFDAIAEALDLDPRTDRIPLSERIDPDALDGLFRSESGETYLAFPLEDLRVVVYSDGDIFVYPSTNREPP